MVVKILSDPGTAEEQRKKFREREIQAVATKTGRSIEDVRREEQFQRKVESAIVRGERPEITTATISKEIHTPTDIVKIRDLGFSVAPVLQEQFRKQFKTIPTPKPKIRPATQQPIQPPHVIIPKEATPSEAAMGVESVARIQEAKAKKLAAIQEVVIEPKGTVFGATAPLYPTKPFISPKKQFQVKEFTREELIADISKVDIGPDVVDLTKPEYGIMGRGKIETAQKRLHERVEIGEKKGEIVPFKTKLEKLLLSTSEKIEVMGEKDIKIFEKATYPTILKPLQTPIEWPSGRKQTAPDLILQTGKTIGVGLSSLVLRGAAAASTELRAAEISKKGKVDLKGHISPTIVSFALGTAAFVKTEPEQFILTLFAGGKGKRAEKPKITIRTKLKAEFKETFAKPILKKMDLEGAMVDKYGIDTSKLPIEDILGLKKPVLDIEIIPVRTKMIIRKTKPLIETKTIITEKPPKIKSLLGVEEIKQRRLFRSLDISDKIIKKYELEALRLKFEFERFKETHPCKILRIETPDILVTRTGLGEIILHEKKLGKRKGTFAFVEPVGMILESLRQIRKKKIRPTEIVDVLDNKKVRRMMKDQTVLSQQFRQGLKLDQAQTTKLQQLMTQIPKTETIHKLQEKAMTAQAFELKTLPILKTSLAEATELKQRMKLDLKQVHKVKLDDIVDVTTKLKDKIKIKTAKPKAFTLDTQKVPRFEPQKIKTMKPVPIPPVPGPPVPKPPLIPKIRKRDSIRDRLVPVRKEPGYDVYVRSRGKFKKANQIPLNRRNARALGQEATDKTTAVTFRLRRAKKVAELPKKYLPPFNLTRYKRKKDLYIEKSKHRIDSIGELRGITFEGWKARRKQGMFNRFKKLKFKGVKIRL